MITGDNPLTAISVARECGLVTQAAYVFAPVFVRGSSDIFIRSVIGIKANYLGNHSTPLAKLEWSCVDDPSWKLDGYSLKPLTPPPHHTFEGDEIDYQDYVLAITGDIFRWMINHAALETLQRVGPTAFRRHRF